MRVTMMLADHAQVADGKLFISGAGWSMGSPGGLNSAIALLFGIGWEHTNERTTFVLRLLDADGHQVATPGPDGAQPIQVGGTFEVGRPPGVLPGSEINVPFAINTGTLQLPPGQQFTWILEVDGRTEADWRLSFATRPAGQQGSPSSS
jgi:hypothetical protein